MPFRSALRFLVLMLALVSSARAADFDNLRRCLKAMGGVAWQLPLEPRLNVQKCGAPAAQFGAAAPADGGAVLELVGSAHVTNADAQALDDAARALAAQQAVFQHVRQLLGRHGYRLQDQRIHPDGSVAEAAFTRQAEGPPQRFDYRRTADNAWELRYRGPLQ